MGCQLRPKSYVGTDSDKRLRMAARPMPVLCKVTKQLLTNSKGWCHYTKFSDHDVIELLNVCKDIGRKEPFLIHLS